MNTAVFCGGSSPDTSVATPDPTGWTRSPSLADTPPLGLTEAAEAGPGEEGVGRGGRMSHTSALAVEPPD